MPHLRMHPEGARDLVFRRHFNAPPERVFGRLTRAHWLRKWLDDAGHTLGAAEFEAAPGGRIRFVWQGPGGATTVTGKVLAITPPRLIRHTARIDPDGIGGAAEVVMRLDPEGAGTAVTLRITHADRAARDRVAASPLAEEMERRCVRLDGMLAPGP